MPPFSIVFGVVGALLLVAGLIGRMAGRRPAVSLGFMITGIIMLVVAVIFMVSGTSDTASRQSAGVTINVSSTATAAAAGDAEAKSAADEADLPVIEPTATPDNLGELKVVHEFTTGVANFDGFRLVELRVYAPQDAQVLEEKEIALKLNQEIYVEFQVTNLRKGPITLEKGYVGAFDPGGESRQIGAVHEGVEVARFQDYKVGITVTLDQPGRWELWPCYKLIDPDETLRNECTEKWQFFEVIVEE